MMTILRENVYINMLWLQESLTNGRGSRVIGRGSRVIGRGSKNLVEGKRFTFAT